ncbi:hypothetical protein D3C72_1450170 [compost metagenome]
MAQALDAFVYRTAGRQHQHRRLFAGAQAFQYRIAVFARQHHIQDHRVIVLLHRQVQALNAIAGDVYGVAQFAQCAVNVGRGFFFVLNQQ